MEKPGTIPEWCAIFNPNAGNGKGSKDRDRISDVLSRNGIKFTSLTTTGRGHATEFTRDILARGIRKIISVGGDGTLHEIINGVFTQDHCHPKDVTIGLIPVGTGNDWGRMFGIPLVYEGAAGVIKEGKTLLHDIGVIDYFSGSEKLRTFFINIAGLGFEAAVIKRTNRQKEKGRSGKAIYFINLLASLISYSNTPVEITIDGETRKTKAFSINIGNGRYCGGGMRQTPDALPDDGLLDITVIKELGKLEIIRSLSMLYDGTVLSHPKIDGFRTTALKVISDNTLLIEADGELLGHTPAEFGIIPSAINIIYGKKVSQ